MNQIAKLQPTKKIEHVRSRLQSFEGRMAERITHFSGSISFVYLHALWFGIWITVNFNLIPGIEAFDPFPFGLLTMIVSLEAIFLSTFIMIAQNRQELIDTVRDIEEDVQELEEDEEVEDIQKDLDEIKQAVELIKNKLVNVEKNQKPTAH